MACSHAISPKSLIKNRPSPSQPWKASIKDWIHGLYAKRFGKSSTSSRPDQTGSPPTAATGDDLPF